MATQIEIPQEMKQLADSSGLAQPMMGLRHEKWAFFTFALIVYIFIDLFFLFFIGIIIIPLAVMHNPDQLIARIFGLLLFGGVAFFPTRYTLYLIRKIRETTTARYYVFRLGMIVEHSGKRDVVAWREVDKVYQLVQRRYANGLYAGTWCRTTLHCTDGRKIEIANRTETARQLSTIISQRVTEHKLPQALSDLHRGQTLDFGPFLLRIDGLTRTDRGKATLSWREVTKVEVKEGFVVIWQRGEHWTVWTEVKASSIPNYTLFMTLAERMARTN